MVENGIKVTGVGLNWFFLLMGLNFLGICVENLIRYFLFSLQAIDKQDYIFKLVTVKIVRIDNFYK